jgi:hypothetical protein
MDEKQKAKLLDRLADIVADQEAAITYANLCFEDRCRVDELFTLFEQGCIEARDDENRACQRIIKSRWGTNDQLWDMEARIEARSHPTNQEGR